MTPTQYRTLVTLVHQLAAQVDRIEERLAFVYPTTREMHDQLAAEVDSILAPGGGIRVFADD
jgi:hypothetical protein